MKVLLILLWVTDGMVYDKVELYTHHMSYCLEMKEQALAGDGATYGYCKWVPRNHGDRTYPKEGDNG